MMLNRLGLIVPAVAAFTAVSVSLLAPAMAQEKPLLLPRMDGAVVYKAQAGNVKSAPDQVVLRFKAGGHVFRLEPDNQPGYILVDRASNQAQLVMPAMHMAMHFSLHDSLDHLLLDPHATFQKQGTAQVAGLDCTRWLMQAPRSTGVGCVTSGGVILDISGHDTKGESVALQATSVQLAPQPDDDFHVPPDYQVLDVSNFGKSPIKAR